MVAYNNKKYYIDIIETTPSSAISIIETDCEVDFAPPLDYKEPARPPPSIPSSKVPPKGFQLVILPTVSFLLMISLLSLPFWFLRSVLYLPVSCLT